MIFTTFAFLQIFNICNIRRIRDDLFYKADIFKRDSFNPKLIIVFILAGILQIIIVTFGSNPFSCYPLGLTTE
jgi:hypothetical protein